VSQTTRQPSGAPPGWSHNPSEFGYRLPIVGLAVVGAAIAAYLGAYQLRIIDDVWEPFFGDGSRTVLDSELSHALIIPDAILGLLAYLADAVLGVVGGRERWRTAPWAVIGFGIVIGPLGLVSVFLVIAQPVLYDTYCTLCLVTGVISVSLIGPAYDEILATLQHLRRVSLEGRSALWQALWGRDADGRRLQPSGVSA
jgi:hypothetical protein